MKKICLTITIIVNFLASCNTASNKSGAQEYQSGYDPVRIQRIKDLQQELIDDGLMGSSHVVIYKDGRMIYNQIVNSEHPDDKEITDETIFPIWSMSKPITTVAAMILLEEGKIMLDDPVGKYIPELNSLQCLDKAGNLYPCKNKITIRDLLTHESGYGYYPEVIEGKFYTINDNKFSDLEDFATKIAEIPLSFEPGTEHQYGLSTDILGRLIEVVSGQGFYEFLKDRIFDPLDMPDTDFDLTVDERKHFQPLFQLMDTTIGYYTREFDELSYQPGSKVHLGGEGLVSTTSDYCHFCEMLLNNGVFHGKRILSPTSVSLMHQPQTDAPSGLPGFRSGFTFCHLTDPITDRALSPEGIFGWGGYHSTWFWIDQKNDLFGLIMTRMTGPELFSMFKKFRIATYQALY